MIETGLWQHLAADSDISNRVSARIHRKPILPKGYTLPAINFFQVHGESIESLAGDSATRIRRYQFSERASTPEAAEELQELVRSRLVPRSDGSGSVATVSYDLPDGTHIQSARLHDERDLPPEEGIGETVYHRMLEVEFTYEVS